MYGSVMNICQVDSCDREAKYASGMCPTHEYRRKAGRPLDVPIGELRKDRPRCSFETCERQTVAKGLCSGHYKQDSLGKPLAPLAQRVRGGAACSIVGCQRPGVTHGLCTTHGYQRDAGVEIGPRRSLRGASLTERLDFYSDEPDQNGCRLWTGGVNRDGYPIIYVGSNQAAMAHRVAYEVATGETLLSSEVIHHKCTVRRCIEATHLQKVTGTENTAEMLERNYYIRRIALLEAEVLRLGGTLPV